MQAMKTMHDTICFNVFLNIFIGATYFFNVIASDSEAIRKNHWIASLSLAMTIR